MKKTIKKTEIYVANDGTEFLTESDALDYEKNILGRLEKIKYFSITFDPDLTEGRGYYSVLGVAIEAESPYIASLMVAELAHQWFGSPIGWVQGCSPMPKYTINDSTKQSFEKKLLKSSIGDYTYPAKYVFLSLNGPLTGYPDPIAFPTREKQLYPEKNTILGKK